MKGHVNIKSDYNARINALNKDKLNVNIGKIELTGEYNSGATYIDFKEYADQDYVTRIIREGGNMSYIANRHDLLGNAKVSGNLDVGGNLTGQTIRGINNNISNANKKIDTNYNTLNSKIDTNVSTINGKVSTNTSNITTNTNNIKTLQEDMSSAKASISSLNNTVPNKVDKNSNVITLTGTTPTIEFKVTGEDDSVTSRIINAKDNFRFVGKGAIDMQTYNNSICPVHISTNNGDEVIYKNGYPIVSGDQIPSDAYRIAKAYVSASGTLVLVCTDDFRNDNYSFWNADISATWEE